MLSATTSPNIAKLMKDSVGELLKEQNAKLLFYKNCLRVLDIILNLSD